jgi:alkanesulfonate monooxygenase SsuD/methylene tetrahydromethanopterin reductase-like flavin-dependent oxidoreductase (luciferase family)
VPGRPRTPIGGARPRILLGSNGSARSYRLAARYADEYNISSPPDPATVRRVHADIDAACQAIGRDPATLTRSAMIGVLVGRDEAEYRDRIAAMTRTLGDDADADWLTERELRWIVGTPDRAREIVSGYAAAGVERIVLQDFLPWDLDMIDVMGDALVGQV